MMPKCPMCGQQTLEIQVGPQDWRYFPNPDKVVKFVIPDARTIRCSSCNESIIEGKELQRWELLAKQKAVQ